jgi:hypothetical protein
LVHNANIEHCPRREMIEMLFAVVHESLVGPKPTCAPIISASGGKAD